MENSSAEIKAQLTEIKELKNTQAHSTAILSEVDSGVFKKLGIDLTCDPYVHAHKLYTK